MNATDDNMDNNTTFMRVSNADIYKAIMEQHQKLDEIEKHIIRTNGQVKLAKWVATTALTLVCSIVLFLLKG